MQGQGYADMMPNVGQVGQSPAKPGQPGGRARAVPIARLGTIVLRPRPNTQFGQGGNL